MVTPHDIKLFEPVMKTGVPTIVAPDTTISGKYIFTMKNTLGWLFDKWGSLHNIGFPDFVCEPSIFQQFEAPALFKLLPNIVSSIFSPFFALSSSSS